LPKVWWLFLWGHGVYKQNALQRHLLVHIYRTVLYDCILSICSVKDDDEVDHDCMKLFALCSVLVTGGSKNRNPPKSTKSIVC